VLEMVARVPCFAYLSALDITETFGEWYQPKRLGFVLCTFFFLKIISYYRCFHGKKERHYPVLVAFWSLTRKRCWVLQSDTFSLDWHPFHTFDLGNKNVFSSFSSQGFDSAEIWSNNGNNNCCMVCLCLWLQMKMVTYRDYNKCQ
jgi:hypothetical protein